MKQPTAPPSGIPLYPELPITDDGTAGVSTSATSGGNVNVASQQQDQYFRLQEISRLRKHLEDEKDKRSQLYKKYRRGINAVDAVDTALISASMGMGIGGVGLLTTVIAAPVVLGLEIAALGCGLLGVAGKFIGRRLSVKAKKHDEVRVLAESKLNTIADHVSRALTDGQISDEEFRLIIDEAQKYTQMKAEIRTGAQKAHAAVTLDEETKNSLIQQGRDEARASLMEKLTGPWVVCSKGTPGRWHVTAHAATQTRHHVSMPRPRGAPRPARGWAVLSGAPEPLNPGSIFLSAPLNFFCAGILKLALGAALDMVEGVVCGAVGAGCWGLWRGCWAGVSGVPWGWVLGAAEGAIGGVVGVPQGERCWGPRRGRLVGWYGAPWGWVLRAALGAVEEVSGGRGGGCWGPGGGRRRRSAGGRGGRCWEPRRGRAGAPDSEYKHPWSPPPMETDTQPGCLYQCLAQRAQAPSLSSLN